MLDWLFGKPAFYRFQDSFGLNDQAVFEAICEALRARINKQEVVLLIAHFPDSFSLLEQQLNETNVPFEIADQTIDDDFIFKKSKESQQKVQLTLAEMLVSSDQKPIKKKLPHVAMVMAERHPLITQHERIVEWCKWLPFPVQLGYFLSLDNPLVKQFLDDRVKELLAQFGVGENELINSNLVSKRLEAALKKQAAKMGQELRADSLEEWIELNFSDAG